jgi:hypothetical protein
LASPIAHATQINPLRNPARKFMDFGNDREPAEPLNPIPLKTDFGMVRHVRADRVIPDALPLLVPEPNHSTFLPDRQQSAILR